MPRKSHYYSVTQADADKVRDLFAIGKYSQTTIAIRCGLSLTTVKRILDGTWQPAIGLRVKNKAHKRRDYNEPSESMKSIIERAQAELVRNGRESNKNAG